MKILTAEQIRNADASTITSEPILSIDLMERAAFSCFQWIQSHLDRHVSIKIFTGPGNNGGDGFALGRMMVLSGWSVSLFMICSPEKLSADALINYDKFIKLNSIPLSVVREPEDFPQIQKSDLLIDALFGTGISRALTGVTTRLVQYMNQSGAPILSIDMPSGLKTEENDGSPSDAIIKARYTLTFQFPKLSFFFSENEPFVGEWIIRDIHLAQSALDEQETPYYYTDIQDIIKIIHHRKRFAHKGNFGHALLIAGSYGKMGAAVLGSKSCLRSGVGLLTTHVPVKGTEIIQTSVPEAMSSVDPNPDRISTLPEIQHFDAIGIGPGIGTDEMTGSMLVQLLTSVTCPLVLDADALNLIAMNPSWLRLLPPGTILTPHPGEFDRLTGPSQNGYHRHCKQIEFSKNYKCIVVLKGAFTSVTSPDGRCCFNSTGNPGMATAGSGDVLTGITLSLLAQGYQPQYAALIAVYLHGLAGDLACEVSGEESLIASDIINNLGNAFQKLKKYVQP